MVLNGNAFSPPLYIRPWSPIGSQPGSPKNSALNGTPQPTSQSKCVDTARAVVGDAVLVGARAHRRVEEGRHVVDGIVEAAGLLEWGAAAEVDEAARHRRRPTPASRCARGRGHRRPPRAASTAAAAPAMP